MINKLILLFAFPLTLLAQVNPPSRTANTIPKVCSPYPGIAGSTPYCDSNLVDNGTQLLYNGTPVGGGTGSGTVSSGTQYAPTYYTATGTTVGGVTPFTGLAYYSTTAAPAAATSNQIQTIIGSNVYQPFGSYGLTTNPLSQFSATTSAQLAGIISDETGTGSAVFANSPTLITPNLGTPSVLTLTNATGLPWSAILAGTNTQTGAFSTAAPWTYSAAGAASTPGLTISGAPYTGGTGTTNFPQLYLNSGATAPTTFNTAGTIFGVNAPSGFSGNFLDFHVNGATSRLNVDQFGDLNSAASIFAFTFAASNTGIIGYSSTSSPSGTKDSILCRLGTGQIGVESAASCTNTLAGATGVMAAQHIAGGGVAPTAPAGTGAGTTPTITVVANSTDLSGYVTVLTGTSPAASATIFTLTFNSAYTTAPKCMAWPDNAATQALASTAGAQFFRASSTTSGAALISGSTALTGATTYEWGYSCTQ